MNAGQQSMSAANPNVVPAKNHQLSIATVYFCYSSMSRVTHLTTNRQWVAVGLNLRLFCRSQFSIRFIIINVCGQTKTARGFQMTASHQNTNTIWVRQSADK